MTDLARRKPFKIRPSQKFPWFKKLCTKKKMTDLMTDFIKGRKSLEERCSEKLQQFKKLYTKNFHFDTNGIMTLTEIQCMHARYRLNKKNHCTIFYRLLQLSTTEVKNRINSSGKRPKYVGTAHTLKPLCITFKIVQL